MAIDRAHVERWLADYVTAWTSYDESAIRALFSDDAEYRYTPWRGPVVGRDAIVAEWLNEQDDPNSWEAHYEPLAVDGDIAVATGQTTYPDEGKTYKNLWVLQFDGEGRCRAFTEWFSRKPAPK